MPGGVSVIRVTLRQAEGPESITRLGWNLYHRTGEVG
jgi:hypothetical protein